MTRRSLFPPLLLTALIALAGCGMMTPRPVTPISDVVSMSKSDLTAGQVLSRVRNAGTTYALKGSDFADLSRRGVRDPVLDDLQKAFVADIDTLTRYAVFGKSPGGCTSCYPQPLDLKTLDSGGNGMGNPSGLGRIYNYSLPAGVPLWVPAYPAHPGSPSISTDDVLAMAKSGATADQMVARIRESRFPQVIENTGMTQLGTQFTPGLSGSELAALGKQGVPDAALDALQAIFLADYIEFARLRYQP